MRIKSINGPALALADEHPAKKFLLAFLKCLEDCPGREITLDGTPPVDQSWWSTTDGKVWRFSGFVYSFLCFDIVLDGFLEGAPHLTASELATIDEIPRLRALMQECAAAAKQGGNTEILVLTDQVLVMLSLWEDYLQFRKESVAGAGGR